MSSFSTQEASNSPAASEAEDLRRARSREYNSRSYRKLKAKGYFTRYYHEVRKPKLVQFRALRRPAPGRDFLFVASKPQGAQRKNVFRMRYKLSLEQYEAMLAEQEYKCKALACYLEGNG